MNIQTKSITTMMTPTDDFFRLSIVVALQVTFTNAFTVWSQVLGQEIVLRSILHLVFW